MSVDPSATSKLTLEDRRKAGPCGPQRPGLAVEATRQYAAERAVDDPIKLGRAARIIRAALQRGVLTGGDAA